MEAPSSPRLRLWRQLPTPCSPLRRAVPTPASTVWEDTYESLTLQCELAHQTPGDPDSLAPL
ncbi:hypothetical protein D623_10003899 [Myotis brandtii]|uniref:Uncharacterized protein n=1 Tax=Myotis brandtii TaxID=109478 RepID=S7PIZ2_MYOBR|nr:hypothetical protein D623_10003899 [Myotis brandtii]